MGDLLIDDHRVEQAVIGVVSRKGIERTVMDEVLKELGWSRATFYRNFSSWESMLETVYESSLDLVNEFFPRPEGDRRLQFEWWWAQLTKLLGSPTGVALRMMRPVAVRRRAGDMEKMELGRLAGLISWVGRRSTVVARATWLLVLTAATTEEPSEALELRELVWAMVANDLRAEPPKDKDADELDLMAATALGEPIH